MSLYFRIVTLTRTFHSSLISKDQFIKIARRHTIRISWVCYRATVSYSPKIMTFCGVDIATTAQVRSNSLFIFE